MRVFITLALLLASLTVAAQTTKQPLGQVEHVCDVSVLLPADVEVAGSTQGFAIHGNYAFSMHDKGQCVIIDLKKLRFVGTFQVDGNTGHCNNSSFGVE